MIQKYDTHFYMRISYSQGPRQLDLSRAYFIRHIPTSLVFSCQSLKPIISSTRNAVAAEDGASCFGFLFLDLPAIVVSSNAAPGVLISERAKT